METLRQRQKFFISQTDIAKTPHRNWDSGGNTRMTNFPFQDPQMKTGTNVSETKKLEHKTWYIGSTYLQQSVNWMTIWFFPEARGPYEIFTPHFRRKFEQDIISRMAWNA